MARIKTPTFRVLGLECDRIGAARDVGEQRALDPPGQCRIERSVRILDASLGGALAFHAAKSSDPFSRGEHPAVDQEAAGGAPTDGASG